MVGDCEERRELADMVFRAERRHAEIRVQGERRIGFQYRAGEIVSQARQIERGSKVDIRIRAYSGVAHVPGGQARYGDATLEQLHAAQREGLKAQCR